MCGHGITIATSSDAWLPYTLRAKPQPEIYEQNAPRLEKALYEVQEKLGIKCALEDHSKFVTYDLEHNGFRLKNHDDFDGNPISVIYDDYEYYDYDKETEELTD